MTYTEVYWDVAWGITIEGHSKSRKRKIQLGCVWIKDLVDENEQEREKLMDSTVQI